VFSNVNGTPLASPAFEPLWQKANELGAVIYIHPAHPHHVEGMEEFWLTALVGFLFDTTLAAAHLTFAGVPERYPNIRWVLTHMGGALPYLAERCDRGYEAFADCRQHISKPPTHYFKQFYYDTVNFNPDAIEFAIKFAGVDHIMAGSDYPHQVGSIPKMLSSLQAIDVSDADRRKILGENAARLLSVGR
jgi:aminocarboxymuconate-semialdehyde decarboxylase